MQDALAQAIRRLLHPCWEQSRHQHRLLPCHSLDLGECRDKSLASAGRQKTLLRWRRLPERDHSQPCSPPREKTTPADEMSGFSVIPDGRSRERSHSSMRRCDLQQRAVSRAHHSLLISSRFRAFLLRYNRISRRDQNSRTGFFFFFFFEFQAKIERCVPMNQTRSIS